MKTSNKVPRKRINVNSWVKASGLGVRDRLARAICKSDGINLSQAYARIEFNLRMADLQRSEQLSIASP